MIFETLRPASKELLLGKVSELDIFLLFCKNFSHFRKPFKSPIILGNESDSSIKSAALLPPTSRGPAILHDFRLGKSFNSIYLASMVTGLNYSDTIKYLCDKFGLTDNSFVDANRPSVKMKIEERMITDNPCIINVKYEAWSSESLYFWRNHGWKPFMLDKACIRPIQEFWVSKDGEYSIKYDRPRIGPISFTYDFYEIDGVLRRKIYNPYAPQKDLKWKNNTTKDIIQALNTIDYHVDTLYIVSSLKDCGPYWTLLEKPCAIAPNSESILMSPNQIRMIRQISDRQIIWYDNDSTGIASAIKQSQLYGFEYKHNPIGSPKDQSDYVKRRGLREFNKLII